MNNSLFANRVVGIEPLTLLDYPDKLAAILFYSGCNFRCPYCYNVDVVNGSMTRLPGIDIKEFAEKRVGKLDAFVFSGGECTIHGDRLLEDMRFIKSLGYLIKIDTNGSNPELVESAISEGLVDYVALDYKAHHDKFGMFYGNLDALTHKWGHLYWWLTGGNTPWEIRTTIHTDIIDEQDVSKMCYNLSIMKYNKTYYIQNFFKDAARYLSPDLNRNPRPFDPKKVDTCGLNVEFRNFE